MIKVDIIFSPVTNQTLESKPGLDGVKNYINKLNLSKKLRGMMYDQVLSRLLGKYSNLVFFYTLEEHNTHSHLIITVSKTLILSL